MQGHVEDVTLAPEPRTRSVRVTDNAASVRASYRRIYRLVALTDALSIAAALLIAQWPRFGFHIAQIHFASVLVGAPLLMVFVAYPAFHLYDAYRYTPAEEFPAYEGIPSANERPKDAAGMSAFALEDGIVYHTYSA